MLTCLDKTNFLLIEEAFAHIKKFSGPRAKKCFGKIFSFYIFGDAIKIKVSENSSPLSITHVDDVVHNTR